MGVLWDDWVEYPIWGSSSLQFLYISINDRNEISPSKMKSPQLSRMGASADFGRHDFVLYSKLLQLILQRYGQGLQAFGQLHQTFADTQLLVA